MTARGKRSSAAAGGVMCDMLEREFWMKKVDRDKVAVQCNIESD